MIQIGKTYSSDNAVRTDEERRNIVLQFLLGFLKENVDKPCEQRRQIKETVMSMLLMDDFRISAAVRQEILHYDDTSDVRIKAILGLLESVSSLTIVENNGEYVSQQNVKIYES